jgi:hypothetical protein
MPLSLRLKYKILHTVIQINYLTFHWDRLAHAFGFHLNRSSERREMPPKENERRIGPIDTRLAASHNHS